MSLDAFLSLLSLKGSTTFNPQNTHGNIQSIYHWGLVVPVLSQRVQSQDDSYNQNFADSDEAQVVSCSCCIPCFFTCMAL